jgi:hypothetical protein
MNKHHQENAGSKNQAKGKILSPLKQKFNKVHHLKNLSAKKL